MWIFVELIALKDEKSKTVGRVTIFENRIFSNVLTMNAINDKRRTLTEFLWPSRSNRMTNTYKSGVEKRPEP